MQLTMGIRNRIGDIPMGKAVVALKSDIERLKEQVQNLE